MSGSFSERLETVRARVQAACARAGRNADDVRVLPVAKAFGPDAVREAAEAGVTEIGENRVQEARQKIPLCPGHLRWHMVGHLQRNKVRDAVRLFDMIHSVDSRRLLETIDAACAEEGKKMPVLLEVNVSGERSKFGMPPEDVPAALDGCGALFSLEVRGLMTVPPFAEDSEESRPFFRRLRELRDQWRLGSGLALDELSMGMSSDFEAAVVEGSTWIRLGTALFGPRAARVDTGRPRIGGSEELADTEA